jgi:hypothetical protein
MDDSMRIHVVRWSVLSLALLLSACHGLGAKPGKVSVTSEPVGAEVWVMGAKVGETPMILDENLVFPLTYPKDKQALYGMVELRKAGCASSTLSVSAKKVERGINAQLDCGQAAPKPAPVMSAPVSVVAPAPVAPPPVSAVPVVPAAPAESTKPMLIEGASIEARLRRVIELRDKGVISEQEAREIRQRILGEL